MSENQLQIIVKESGLDSTKAKFILDNFQHYFELASEWEKKAKTIVVTSGDQKEDMKLARDGRLELREKRIAIEKSRKDLKEQSLREGKAIDGIANILKALIVPIEDYLESQERFVEIQEEKKTEARRLEIEKRLVEEDRIAAEKAAAEQERLRLENEKLKKEAQEREQKMAAERRVQEEAMAAERSKADAERKAIEAKAKAERDAIEAKAKAEKEKQDAKLKAERAKAEAEREKQEAKLAAEKAKAKEKLEAERKEKERLEKLLENQIQCPFCYKKFALKVEAA